MKDVIESLDHRCAGGTDFDGPVSRAVELIQEAGVMHQADVVVITDGKAELSEDLELAAREMTEKEGVSWFVVGICDGIKNIVLQR